MTELNELNKLLNSFKEIRNNHLLTQEQIDKYKECARNYVSNIIDGDFDSILINFDVKNNMIRCCYRREFGKSYFIRFEYFDNKCSIINNESKITLTIE